MASTYNVIVSGAKNIGSKTLQVTPGAGDKGNPLKLKAESGARFQLQDAQAANLKGPDRLRLKRVGNDLEVMLESSGRADIVIQDYYSAITTPTDGLVGTNASGALQSYVPLETAGASSALNAPSGQVVSANLSGPALSAVPAGSVGGLVPAAAGPSLATIVGATAGVAAIAAGGGSSSKVNVAPEITSGDTGTVTENAPTSTVVYKVTATDADPGTTLRYSLSGTDAAMFDINATTGDVTLKAAANFEGKSSYTINVVATDGTASVSKAVKINVANVNEAPVFTSADSGSVAENATNNPVVYNAAATDPEGSKLTYSLSREDAQFFNIDATTGVVTLKAAANYEAKSSYTIDVVATDGTLSTTKTVVINVTNVNEAPVISSGGTATVAENAATSTVVYQAVATDVDAGTTLTYSLGGTDATLFDISSTGAVTLKASANFEAKSSYNIEVIASDGTLSTSKAVAVTVTNVNEAPVITSGGTASIAENEPTSKVVYQAVATDVDAGTTLTYSLGGTDAALFEISSTGAVTLKASANFEAKSSYNINVIASDGALSTSKAVTVTVTDVNEAPANGALTAQTLNRGDAFEYNIASAFSDVDGNTLSYTAQWSANGQDGWVALPAWLTLSGGKISATAQAQAQSGYVRVKATDTGNLESGWSQFQLTANNKAIITVGANSGTLDEDSTVVLQSGGFAITDVDAGQAVFLKPMGAQDVAGNENQYKVSTDYGTFTFTYKGTNPGAWTYEINNASAKVQELAKDQSYVDRIEVVSADGTAKATVNITIFGANDPATAMTGQFSGNVTENSATNTATGVITVTDKDIGQNKVKAESQTGTYGNFAITADGRWTYTLDNDKAATQALKAGETKTETFVVRSYDETAAVEKSVTITITGANDAPVFQSADTATVRENDPISTVVYTAQATDAEGVALTYTLGGTDAALFDITSAGVVTLKASANYEAKSSYNIDVIASDGSLSTTKAVKVNVTNVNEAPVITSSATGTVAENAPTSTVVYQVEATDVDAGTTLSYSLSGTDAALFDISTTGAVTLKASANFEAKPSYSFNVIATDNAGVNALSATKAVTITVTNANEAPVITSGDTATVVENTAADQVVYTVTATDVDGGTFTYSLGGTDADKFNIDAKTGAVKLNASANYEAKSSYSINVIASDGALSTTKAVTVNVSDVNEAPVITSAGTATVAENAATSTVVYQAVATDVDAGTTLTYSLGGTDAALFDISSTGAVTLKASANYEAKSSYSIEVIASDGALSMTKAVTVTVTDVNEAPVISSGGTATVAENAATSTVVYQAVATDDAGTTLTYSLSGTDAALFDISSTGAVTLKASANYEAKSSYNINVIASDGALSTSKAVTVNVTNVNEAPTISSVGTASIAENAAISTVVYQAVATDVDAGTTLTYSLGGTDAALFDISSTGAVTLKASANYEAKSSYSIEVIASDGTLSASKAVAVAVTNVNEAPTFTAATATASKVVTVQQATEVYQAAATDVDAGTTLTYSLGGADAGLFEINASTGVVTTKVGSTYVAKDYNISVTASDGNLSATQAVKVTVTGPNNAPVITSADTATVAENAATSTVVYQAVATDVDAGTTLTYSLGGTDAALFDISSTGAVTLKNSANFEAKSSYNINVIASDGNASVSKAVKVNVTNVDEAPVFSSGATATATVAENAPVSTVVYRAAATDPEGAVLTYTLGGTDAALFDISSTGAVTLKASANYEAKSSYSIEVIASDGTLTTRQAVAVAVTNVNEAPTISSAGTASIAENAAISTVVYQAVATDVDAGTTLTYSLGGTDAALFDISSTGAVTLKASANYEAKNNYTIDVIASDGTLSTSKTVAVTVTNVNEAPVFTSGKTATVAENAATSTVVYTAAAGDVDAGTTLTYSLGTSGDNTLFNIDTKTGAVTLKASADFETKQSYTINVIASDGTLTTSQDVTVTVTNVNEAPKATFSTAQNFTEDDGAKGGQLTATDPDTGSTLVYTLNAPIAGLTLNSNGSWSFDTAHSSYQSLGLGVPKAITVNYTVSDGTLSDSTGSFVINLTGVNDLATITGTRTGLVKNVVLNNVATGDLDVSDVDSGEAVFSGTGITTSLVSNGQFSFDNASGSWGYSLTTLATAQADARIVDQKLTVTSKDNTDSEDVSVGIYVAGTSSTSNNLVLEGAASLDLNALRALDSSIKVDKVDLSSTSANTLKLDAASVFAMTTSATHKLVVEGGSNDTVDLVGTWAKATATQTANAKTYDVYTLDGAEVWIQNTVNNVI